MRCISLLPIPTKGESGESPEAIAFYVLSTCVIILTLRRSASNNFNNFLARLYMRTYLTIKKCDQH